jgi:hypothetical protein
VLELLLCLLPSVAPEHTGEFGDIGIELRDNYDIMVEMCARQGVKYVNTSTHAQYLSR